MRINWSEYFEYCEDSPTCLINTYTRSRKAKEGEPAGSLRPGYAGLVCIEKKRYSLPRVIWELFYGEIPPKHVIQFIDGDNQNNKIENLKLISASDKGRSIHQYPIGTYYCPSVKKWRSNISIDGVITFIGHYKTFEEGVAAYQAARRMITR